MALNIYLQPEDTGPLSKNGSFNNPLGVTFDGRIGGTKEVLLFLRNGDPSVRYTDITLTLEDSDVDSHINSLDGTYQWKLSLGDSKPTANDWANIAAGNSITFPDIGDVGLPDTSTYLPFWLLVKVPANLSIQNIKTISFVLEAEEVAI